MKMKPAGKRLSNACVQNPAATYLSITARHSFLHVNRLPRRSLKVPEVAVTGGGVCLHSGSSIGIGAGLMLNVAPTNNKHCVSQCSKDQAHFLTPAHEKKQTRQMMKPFKLQM